MKENEWHNIEDKHDLPWEEGVYEFRDKDGEIEEVCILLRGDLRSYNFP